MAKRSKRVSLRELTDFHRDVLDVLLRFCADRGINTRAQLNSLKGRPLLDVSLWKLLETEGKYGGSYVSEGVHALEVQFGRPPDISYGTWPEKLLVQHLGQPPTPDGWLKHPDYCCALDHVSERSKLIDALLIEPHRSREILDHCLLGCVVLRSEHGRIASGPLNPSDPWGRYRDATPRLNVWDRHTKCWVSLAPISLPSPIHPGNGAK